MYLCGCVRSEKAGLHAPQFKKDIYKNVGIRFVLTCTITCNVHTYIPIGATPLSGTRFCGRGAGGAGARLVMVASEG